MIENVNKPNKKHVPELCLASWSIAKASRAEMSSSISVQLHHDNITIPPPQPWRWRTKSPASSHGTSANHLPLFLKSQILFPVPYEHPFEMHQFAAPTQQEKADHDPSREKTLSRYGHLLQSHSLDRVHTRLW